MIYIVVVRSCATWLLVYNGWHRNKHDDLVELDSETLNWTVVCVCHVLILISGRGSSQ